MNEVPQVPEYREDLENALRSVDSVLTHKDSTERLGEVSGQFSVAVRALVRLRNHITTVNRTGAGVSTTPSLTHINALISLMAGIEYPLAGIHWPRIQRVSDDLEQMLATEISTRSRQER